MATYSSILARKNSIDRGAQWATIHGVAKSQTWIEHTHTLAVGERVEHNLI